MLSILDQTLKTNLAKIFTFDLSVRRRLMFVGRVSLMSGVCSANIGLLRSSNTLHSRRTWHSSSMHLASQKLHILWSLASFSHAPYLTLRLEVPHLSLEIAILQRLSSIKSRRSKGHPSSLISFSTLRDDIVSISASRQVLKSCSISPEGMMPSVLIFHISLTLLFCYKTLTTCSPDWEYPSGCSS